MAITVPVSILNQTGAQWAAFSQEAIEKGIKPLEARTAFLAQAQKSAAASMKADLASLGQKYGETEKSARSLVETVRAANAVNLTPRGFELRSLRLAQMFESISQSGPKAVAAMAAVGGTVGALAIGYKVAESAFDHLIEKTKTLKKWIL